jgi:hypothetical protein
LKNQTFVPKEETKMKLYGAIDLHSDNSVLVVSDEQDRVVYEKRLANDLALITQQLEPYRESLQGIVVESTYMVLAGRRTDGSRTQEPSGQ